MRVGQGKDSVIFKGLAAGSLTMLQCFQYGKHRLDFTEFLFCFVFCLGWGTGEGG